MILNQNGEAFIEPQFFNTAFIIKNKIKSIHGSYSFKKDGDLIREVPGSYTYTFDQSGKLTSMIDIKWNGKTLDTIVHYYSFDSSGKLCITKESEFGGITQKEMLYDSIGRIASITNFRVAVDKFGTTIKSTEVNQETFSYHGGKKTTYNSYGLPYLISSEETDTDGYLVSRKEKLKRSGTLSTKKYQYNEKGYLDVIETYYNKTIEPVESVSFLYDPFGNLTERLDKKMNILVNELQLIYDDKTQLLYSIIRRDPSTNFMAIIRFKTYEYYP
jgi:hypothetical protein